MAWIFSLSARLSDEESAKRFCDHFRDKFIPSEWGGHELGAGYRYSEEPREYWAMVTPSNVSRTGVSYPQDAIILSFVGNKLYELLVNAPHVYSYALVGVEVDECRYMPDLLESPEDIAGVHWDGFVIENKLYDQLGRPGYYSSFNEYYVWREYKGEKYRGHYIQ